jgi:hypothetical protein
MWCTSQPAAVRQTSQCGLSCSHSSRSFGHFEERPVALR